MEGRGEEQTKRGNVTHEVFEVQATAVGNPISGR